MHIPRLAGPDGGHDRFRAGRRTHAESQDPAVLESLKPLYKEHKAKKYLVAVFSSGTEDLKSLTCDLLRYNRVRLRELEKQKEKAHDYAR